MPWIILLLASIFEIAWVSMLKRVLGFSDVGPLLTALTFLIISVGLLKVSSQSIPIGVAYGVWTGFGVIGGVLIGSFQHGENLSPYSLICIAFILLGAVGLKIVEHTQI